MCSLFKLPLEILFLIYSFLSPEDIVVLQDVLPFIISCSSYKRMKIEKAKQLNQKWGEIIEYRRLHEKCLHICLPLIRMDPHKNNVDDFQCYFEGRGIYCLPFDEEKYHTNPGYLSHQLRYNKEVVPLKEHIHCICEKVGEEHEYFCKTNLLEAMTLREKYLIEHFLI